MPLSLVTLADIKAHCRIEHSEEDALLSLYGEAAEHSVLRYLNQTAPISDHDGTPFSDTPAPIRAAVLLHVGDLYEHREAQSEISLTLNRAAAWLLDTYRLSMGV